jgi:hypothetical protein
MQGSDSNNTGITTGFLHKFPLLAPGRKELPMHMLYVDPEIASNTTLMLFIIF